MPNFGKKTNDTVPRKPPEERTNGRIDRWTDPTLQDPFGYYRGSKNETDTGVFLWILQNVLEHLFSRTPPKRLFLSWYSNPLLVPPSITLPGKNLFSNPDISVIHYLKNDYDSSQIDEELYQMPHTPPHTNGVTVFYAVKEFRISFISFLFVKICNNKNTLWIHKI